MAYDSLLRLPTKSRPAGSSGGGLPSPPASGNIIIGQGASWASKALSGDATLAASGILTLANTAVTPGTYGDSTHVGQFMVDAKGRLTFAANVAIVTSSGTVTSISQSTGITLTPNPITSTGTVAIANTAVTPGTYGDATHVGQFTVDQQGRLTFAANVAITFPSSSGPLLDASHNTDTVAHTPVLGDMIYANATPKWQALAGSISATKKFLTQTGTGAVSAAPSWGDVTAANVTLGQALTKTDDTNVTLTLGGSPTVALLAATSLTLGWTGTLAVSRGGTGDSTLTAHGVLIGEGTSAVAVTAAGTSGQLLIGQGATSDPSFNTMSGDATISNTGALTLATVNANVGSFGSATSVATFTVNAKGLITAAANVAIGGLASIDGVHNIAWAQFNSTDGTTGILDRVGCTGTQNTDGTVTVVVNDFVYRNYATATTAGAAGGISVNVAADTRIDHLPDVTIQFRTGASANDVANVRIWVGLASITGLDSTTGQNNMMAFRYDTTAGDTNWKAFSRDNAGGNGNTDTGVAVTADTSYKFRIVAVSTTSVDFYINDVLVANRTTNLPGATNKMNFISQWYNQTAGTARAEKVHRFYMTSI